MATANKKNNVKKATTKKSAVPTALGPRCTIIGIVRDHSGSMSDIAHKAKDDYNTLIKSIKGEVRKHKQAARVSTFKCGVGSYGIVEKEISLKTISSLEALTEYRADGHQTPLWDSVSALIEDMKRAPEASDPNTAFLINVITDGANTICRTSSPEKLAQEIKSLTATDRWTFTFRVPRGNTYYITNIGVPAGNVLEWEQTEQGFETATRNTLSGMNTYFGARAAGVTKSATFFADLSNVKISDVKRNLVDISNEVVKIPVGVALADKQIRDVVESKIAGSYKKGTAFYELIKTEEVQSYKQIMIKDKVRGCVFGGANARQLLGLPDANVKVAPGDHGQYQIFVQSTSVNRRIPGNTTVMVWKNAV